VDEIVQEAINLLENLTDNNSLQGADQTRSDDDNFRDCGCSRFASGKEDHLQLFWG